MDMPIKPKKFIADAMVGKLARWLRAIGYDTLYLKDVPDRVIVSNALKDNRTILTRDHHFEKMKSVHHLILLESTRLTQQFQQVVRTLDLDIGKYLFTRCMECNGVLQLVLKENIKNQIPVHVYQTKDKFCRCPDCGKIYWQGTHLPEIQKKIYEMLQSHLST